MALNHDNRGRSRNAEWAPNLLSRLTIYTRHVPSPLDVSALHVDGGGVSDLVFAVSHFSELEFEPRLPHLSDRKLYAFELRAHYGRLAPCSGSGSATISLPRAGTAWAGVMAALRNRRVAPSTVLKKLSAFRQQNSLTAVHRTDDPGARRPIPPAGRPRHPGGGLVLTLWLISHSTFDNVLLGAIAVALGTIVFWLCRRKPHASRAS